MYLYYFANTYGSGGYDASTYNGAATTPAPAPGTPPPTGTGTVSVQDTAAPGGSLANTGFDILLAVSFACLIIFAALLVRFWKRKPATEDISLSD
jgi:hypothetical protein